MRVIVTLRPADFDQLRDFALQERRSVRDQAAIWIERAIAEATADQPKTPALSGASRP